MSMRKVLEPFDFGGIRLPNRIVFPAFQTNYATRDGYVTDRLIRMYEKLAQGGNGLIIVGGVPVSDEGMPNTNPLRINSDKHIAGLKELFSIIKKRGTVPAIQLMHAGRQTLSVMTGHPLEAASAIPCPVMKEMPVELDKNGINRIQEDFVAAAGRAKKAGSIPICCRISADEFVEGGLKLNDTRKIAKRLVDAGADIISVAAGTYASMEHMAPKLSMGIGVHVYLAKEIRDSVDAAVICSDNIRNLEFADKIISEKKADLVAICRPQVADPFFVNKSIRGEPVVECTDCGNCLYFLRGENSVSCPQNPY